MSDRDRSLVMATPRRRTRWCRLEYSPPQASASPLRSTASPEFSTFHRQSFHFRHPRTPFTETHTHRMIKSRLRSWERTCACRRYLLPCHPTPARAPPSPTIEWVGARVPRCSSASCSASFLPARCSGSWMITHSSLRNLCYCWRGAHSHPLERRSRTFAGAHRSTATASTADGARSMWMTT